ncbi:MAG: DUF4349 domain-containing protein [Deltaproteobacteria bacterium]
MKLLSAALVASIALNGCSKKTSEMRVSAAAEATAMPVAAPGAAATKEDHKPGGTAVKHVDTRKVIRTGRIELTVDSVDASRGKLEELVQSAGGYIDSTQVEQHGSSSTATIVIRIPADAFGSLLPTLHQIGEVTAESTNAADITDQFVDTEAQLASAQQLEKRLLEIATAKNGTLEQILTVEKELARVRGEIESYQGHLKQWNDQVSLSTLTITMAQKQAMVAIAPPPPPATLGSKTSQSFKSSIDALRDVASWLLVSGVALLPWLLVLVPGALGLRRLWRRHRWIPVAVATINPPSAEVRAID